jgi:hypothetical protein
MQLTVRVSEVLGLGLVAGWSATLLFLPRRFAFRWIVFAPIVGIAVVTVFGLPLSLLGLPVKSFALPLVFILAACAIGVTFFLRQRHPLLRGGRLFAYLRARGIRLLFLAGLVTSLSSYIMTAQARSDVADYWGSGDLGAYWAVAEYLLHHGGNDAAYQAQTEFRSEDVADHLARFARLGNMVYLATIAGVLDPTHVHRLPNPTIVATMILLVATGMTWLDSMRCSAFWVLLIVSCHPFLYFLLYFSYASQATGVLLTFTGFLVAREAVLRGPLGKGAWHRGAIAGMLFAAALSHYPMMPPVIGAIGMVLLVAALRSSTRRLDWRMFSGIALTIVTLTFFYIPASWRELSALRGAPLPGWNWQRPIGFGEIAGLSTVLGYALPSPLSTPFDWALEIAGGVFLLGGVALAWFTRRDRLVAFTLIGFTGLTAANALFRTFQHVPNASHSYVKALSIFAIFVMFACLAGWTRFFEQLPRWSAHTATMVMLFLWLPCELRAVRFGMMQEPRFRESLIELTRRQTERGAHVWLSCWPACDTPTWRPLQKSQFIEPIAPIVRNIVWLNPVLDGSAPSVKIQHVSQAASGPAIGAAPPYIVTTIVADSRPPSR